MDKKWMAALLGLGILLPGAAEAVGLGELRILSGAGEPFRAEIPIRSLTAQETASGLRVALAPESAFTMISVPRSPLLDHWQFQVQEGSQPRITISSPDAVSVPDLPFLVQLEWGGGRLIREYTVHGAATMVTAASVAGPAGTSQFTPASGAVAPQPGYPSAPALKSPEQGWSRVSVYGPVRNDENLHQIATRVRISNAVGLGQIMAAIVRHNPQAFGNGNPNTLLKGAMLRMPTLSEVTAMNPQQADAFLARRQRVVQQPAAAAQTSAAPQGRLVLSAAPASIGSGIPGAPIAAAFSTLQGDVKTLQQQGAAFSQENQSLRQTVAKLQQRLQAQQHLLDVQQQQLLALAKQQSDSRNPLNNPLVWGLVGGNALLLLLVLWLYGRIRRLDQEVAEGAAGGRAPVSGSGEGAVGDGSPALKAPLPSVSAPAVIPVAAAPSPAAAPSQATAAAIPVREEAAEAQQVTGDVDPVEQADLYLTYGRADSAVAVLEEALEKHPARKDLYVKLLDVYALKERRDDYLDMAERMRGRFGRFNAAWKQVAAQGARLFPGNPLFAEEEDGKTGETGQASKPVAAPVVESPVPATPVNEKEVLDFRLDLPAAAAPANLAAAGLDFEPDGHMGRQDKEQLFRSVDAEFRALEEAPANEGVDDQGMQFLAAEEVPGKPSMSSAESAVMEAHAAADVHTLTAVGMDWDAVGTKLDLAKAYMEMGDQQSARELLEEVSKEGNTLQQGEARQLLAAI